MTQICLDKRITIFPRWKTLIKFGIGETLNKIVLIKHKDLRDSHNKTDNSHLEGKLNKREARDYKILIYAKGTTFLSSDLGFWLGLGVRSFPPHFLPPPLKTVCPVDQEECWLSDMKISFSSLTATDFSKIKTMCCLLFYTAQKANSELPYLLVFK